MVYSAPLVGDLRQAEIIGNLTLRTLPTVGDRPIVTPLQYAIIVGQDCDLERHFQGAVKSPVVQTLILGALPWTSYATTEQFKSSTIKKRLYQNKEERFHYLQAYQDGEVESFPSLVVDFRSVCGIAIEEICFQLQNGAARRLGILNPPYRDHMQLRMASYLARVPIDPVHLPPPD